MKAHSSLVAGSLPALLCAFSLSIAPPRAHAAEAGAWETFFTQDNSDAWTVYDFADDSFNYGGWQDLPVGEEYIYFQHSGDAPVWFYSDLQSNSGQGALIGDYASKGITGILCAIFIDSLDDFDQVDCAILTTGPFGYDYYYTDSFYHEDFDDAGWWELRFGFEETWYYYDGDGYVPVTITQQMLSDIDEIGFRFFPTTGSTLDAIAAVDDVKLEPSVAAPAFTVSQSPTEFMLTFTPVEGNECSVERMITEPLLAWLDVPGETGIIGPDPHVFTAPFSAGKDIFRVESFPHYTPFTTLPPIQP